jgi:hypothetical protein
MPAKAKKRKTVKHKEKATALQRWLAGRINKAQVYKDIDMGGRVNLKNDFNALIASSGPKGPSRVAIAKLLYKHRKENIALWDMYRPKTIKAYKKSKMKIPKTRNVRAVIIAGKRFPLSEVYGSKNRLSAATLGVSKDDFQKALKNRFIHGRYITKTKSGKYVSKWRPPRQVIRDYYRKGKIIDPRMSFRWFVNPRKYDVQNRDDNTKIWLTNTHEKGIYFHPWFQKRTTSVDSNVKLLPLPTAKTGAATAPAGRAWYNPVRWLLGA